MSKSINIIVDEYSNIVGFIQTNDKLWAIGHKLRYYYETKKNLDLRTITNIAITNTNGVVADITTCQGSRIYRYICSDHLAKAIDYALNKSL